MHNLTPVERRILAELLRGHAQKEIASQTGLAVRTVKFHLARLRHFYGCRSLPQLAGLVAAQQMLDPGTPLEPGNRG